jgi:hypothetical protein
VVSFRQEETAHGSTERGLCPELKDAATRGRGDTGKEKTMSRAENLRTVQRKWWIGTQINTDRVLRRLRGEV